MSQSTCWACNSALSTEQKLCTECNNWQNWRRYFNLSSATLSLIIALISVTSLSIPLFRGLIEKKQPYLVLTGVGEVKLTNSDKTKLQNYKLDLHFRNAGTAPAVILNPITCALWDAWYNSPKKPYAIFEMTTSSSTFLEKGKVMSVAYQENGKQISIEEKVDDEGFSSVCILNYNFAEQPSEKSRRIVFSFTDEDPIWVINDPDQVKELQNIVYVGRGG